MRLFFDTWKISNIKTKHVLLAVVGMLFLFFYMGIVLSKLLQLFRMVVFTIVLFLMGLYGMHRFKKKGNVKGEGGEKKYTGHVGLGALLLFVFFVGIQTQMFLYDYIVGMAGGLLLLPAIRDVMKRK